MPPPGPSTGTTRPSSRNWPRAGSARRPRYRVVAEHGPDHSKTFEVETELKGEVVGRATGRSKKDAEQAAAKLALDTLSRRFAGELAQVAVEPVVPAPPVEAPAVATSEASPLRGEHAGGAEGEAPGGAARPREARSSRPEAAGAARRPTGREERRGPQGARPQAVAGPKGAECSPVETAPFPFAHPGVHR